MSEVQSELRRPQPAVRLRALRQAYPIGLGLKRRAVLHGIDLELAAASGVGLVGPNGSGKSTLLRLLAGIDEPLSGEVEVLGGHPRAADVVRRVGWMGEDSPFPAELDARAVLELVGTLQGGTRRQVRAAGRALLARVGLEREERTPLARYSRGMLRRLGLAAAFLSEPELVLLDEPTAGLDAPGLEVLDVLVGEARARGATVLIASHLVDDVHRHCQRLLVLQQGRLVADGTPAELLGAAPLGALDIEVAGLAPGELAGLEQDVTARGGRWLGVRPARASLLALYARLEGER